MNLLWQADHWRGEHLPQSFRLKDTKKISEQVTRHKTDQHTYNFNFPLPHTVGPIIAANDTIPTVVADACGPAPPP